MQKDMKIMVTKLGLLSVRKDTMLVGTVKQIKYRLCLKFKAIESINNFFMNNYILQYHELCLNVIM